MKKADLHLHSKYSNRPSEWFLQKLGAAESYTEPETIYKEAKQRGMDYITITDHNSISGALDLKKLYPRDTFVSVESTVYFPEDSGKVHILIYDITEEQFAQIQTLRRNIYLLRDFIRDNNIAYSVAHATYSVDGTLKESHIEKLILLFDNFEVINGGRNESSNNTWRNFLISLTEEDINKLKNKHNIETFGTSSWIKRFTGGSDDHAGIFFAKTYTASEAVTIEDFIENLKKGKTAAYGRSNDYRGLAFTIYKVAYDYAKIKSDTLPGSFFSQLNSFIFENKKLGFKDKLKLFKIKKDKSNKKNRVTVLVAELVEEISSIQNKEIEKKLEIVYDKVSEIVDEYAALLIEIIQKDLKKGDFFKLIRDISATIPGIFISVPFLSTFKHMFNNRNVLENIKKELGKDEGLKEKKILWFTDTFEDLNGVSVTLKNISEKSEEEGYNIKIAASISGKKALKLENIMRIESIGEFDLPYYEKYKLKVPSILKTIKKVYEYNPDEIYVSTPGPIGFMGVMLGKLLNLNVVGVYHTDFTMQSRLITKSASVETMLESYTRWFYSMCKEIKVPTEEYIKLLSERGFKSEKMTVFKRALENNKFYKFNNKSLYLKEIFGVKKGVTLLYAGRVSKDKSIEFLLEAVHQINCGEKKINLVIAGDGPDFEELSQKYRRWNRVYFIGRVPNEELNQVYNSSDIFVFPSTTDTFGMAVLEAQGCGVPAIVSDIGGPKEIIKDGETGFVVRAENIENWIEKINYMVDIVENNPEEYNRLSENSIKRVNEKYSWDRVFEDLLRTEKVELTSKKKWLEISE
jgi:glycosyltransferase involved in cell wall biosynthesis